MAHVVLLTVTLKQHGVSFSCDDVQVFFFIIVLASDNLTFIILSSCFPV